MAFPATYNISYYKGDLYSFVIRPKDSAGDPFPISDTTHNVYFYISTTRGAETGDNTITATSTITGGNIVASIRPSDSASLNPGTTYFYDISVEKQTDSNEIYTLLTGTISVTADITEPSS